MPLDGRAMAGSLNSGRGSSQQSASAVLAWAAAEMADLTGPPPAPYEGWTPDLVSQAMLDAIRWVRRQGGSAGPRGMRSAMPDYVPTFEELLEDFGIPERADDEPERALEIPPTPAQVSRHLAVLEWPADYLCPANVGSARMLGLWAACKVTRRPFAEAVKGRRVARGAAYALRDRGLSIISQGLEWDGVPVVVVERCAGR
ncbi:hypothetical protein ACEN2J_14520 [Pseudorhodobacter sp. W20_MBD10_FR17]|uniref:hypothetical protein n=1 Tax=Pseudorhodobacter sp. W20_MBD10_FR17 TaxID=3240266 RepID=UPI003F95F7B5